VARQVSSSPSPSSLALHNFLVTCKSPETRYVYGKALQYFMNYLGIEHDQYDKLLDKDPKNIQIDICNYITTFSNKIAPRTLSLYVEVIQKFYTMNDITTLNWKKIKSFEPERVKVACDDPNAPEWCSVPTECPDGTVIPPGEQCPDVDYEEPGLVPEEGQGGEDDSNDNGDNNNNNDNGSDQPDDPPEGGDSDDSDNQGGDSGQFFE
jgi:hypothetical protein